MGLAIAEAALARGAEVILVAANVTIEPPASARLIRVETTAELAAACNAELGSVDAGIMAAAGTLSPLLWTPYWFVSKHFIKRPVAPLNVRPTFNWVMSAAAVCLFYVLILGPGFRVGGG